MQEIARLPAGKSKTINPTGAATYKLQKSHSIQIDFMVSSSNMPITIEADVQQMELVLIYKVKNAMESHGPKKQTIDVKQSSTAADCAR